MTDALVRVASSGKKVFAVTELLKANELMKKGGDTEHTDPHVWMDPLAWSKAIEVVRDKLMNYDPKGVPDYQQNAAQLLEQFKELHQYAEKALHTIPQTSRVLITAHDAFAYLGNRYGLEVVGIQGLSTESEAGVKDIQRIVELLVKRKIQAVFIESTVSDRNVKALIEGAKAQAHTVQIGGELFSDAMGKAGSYEGTYVGMLDHNVTTIALALGGKAPQGGMHGKLAQEH